MAQAEDLTGMQFGRLTVLYRDELHQSKVKSTPWKCRCTCGNEITTYATLLKQGKTQSCGCLRSERLSEAMRRFHQEMRINEGIESPLQSPLEFVPDEFEWDTEDEVYDEEFYFGDYAPEDDWDE